MQANFSLKNYNTFGVDAYAKQFISVTTAEELIEALSLEKPFLILGGGSNVLFTNNTIESVIQINLKGIEVVEETTNKIILKVAAGENWHQFVMWCVEKNYGGLENLALIPGNVGACPIQNIGAYGVEVKDCIVGVDTLEIATLNNQHFKNEECQFNYRDSIFKNHLKGKQIITAVSFRLTKQNHLLNIDYGAIADELYKNNITTPTIKDIAETVIKIRESKLPNPAEIGNGGSFFKNPIISIEHFKTIQSNYPSIPSYPVSETLIKVPAGWLIEKAGLKGFRDGDAGVHKNQALVLVNYGNASGIEILNLAKHIQKSIKEIFQITLDIEVNII